MSDNTMDREMADRELRGYRQQHDILLNALDRQTEQSLQEVGQVRGKLFRSRFILEKVRGAAREGNMIDLLMWIFCALWNAVEHDVQVMSDESVNELTIRMTTTESWLAEIIRRYGQELWQAEMSLESKGSSETAVWEVLGDYVQLTNYLLAATERFVTDRN